MMRSAIWKRKARNSPFFRGRSGTRKGCLFIGRGCGQWAARGWPGNGPSCAGVAIHVAQSIGAECFDVDGYGTVPANGELERALDAQPCLQQVDLADRQAGDLLLMRFAAEPQHLAICAGDTIVHAYEAVGKCCEHRLSSVWESRIVRVYRFEGIA